MPAADADGLGSDVEVLFENCRVVDVDELMVAWTELPVLDVETLETVGSDEWIDGDVAPADDIELKFEMGVAARETDDVLVETEDE